MNQIQPPQIVSYRPIKDGGYYIIKVSALFGDNDCYRVSLKEEYDDHTTQIADINLRRPRDRRWLEQYVRDLSHRVHITGIYFGTCDCLGYNHYPLDKFIEQHKNFPSMDYLQDIHIQKKFI